MKLETAIYGEVNNGHALRATSGDVEFARSIAGRFDLPSSPPAGVAWSPAISGFPAQGHYVLARTFLDTQAARGNMVLAHALFAPLDTMQDFRALNRLIDLLAPTVDRIPAVASVTMEDGDDPVEALELEPLARLLVDRGAKPVVRLEAKGLEALIAALWRTLWPSMRRNFGFRLSFTPDDLFESPLPSLVCTPESLAARWRGYPILGQTIAPDSAAARFLSGAQDAAPVSKFGDSVGHSNTSLSNFGHLVQAAALLSADPGLEELAAALRLVNLLSPDPKNGTKAKAEMVGLLKDAIRSATPAQIMQLRNLALNGFEDLAPIWGAVAAWTATRPFDREGEINATAPLIRASQLSKDAIPAWRAAIEAGGCAAATAQPRPFAVAFWAWQAESPTLLGGLLKMLPTDNAMEKQLVKAMPVRIKVGSADLLAAWLGRGWLVLHGATLAASIDPAEAVLAQLAVDKDITFSEGLRAALFRAKPADILAIAALHVDDRLDQIGGALVATNHELAKLLDFALPESQRLWAAAIKIDKGSWQAPDDPYAARRKILDAVLDGRKVFTKLLTALATTPLSDLSDYSSRNLIWSRLETPGPFLEATARAWLDHAASGSAEPLDDQLETVVLQPDLLDRWLGRGWGEALNVIASLKRFSEARAVRWFDDRSARLRDLSQQSAERLGHIIVERRWSSLLGRVRDRLSTYSELKTTLRICASMLSPITRWTLGISALSRDEKWDSFAELAADLYPPGPADRDLWERSGGHNSDLLIHTTGANGWRHALRLARQGNGPKVSRLLTEMQRDFRNNSDLRVIAGDRDVVGW